MTTGRLRSTFPLHTDRLILRPFEAGDLDAVYAFDKREDVARYLYHGPRTRRETRDALERRMVMRTIDGDSDALRLAVLVRETNALVGDVSLAVTSWEHRQGEIGFILHPDQQGRGYAPEAARELLRIAFEELQLHRVVGRAEPRNTPSWRVMEKLSMRREALLRENEWVKGEWQSEVVYALLATEWEEHR